MKEKCGCDYKNDLICQEHHEQFEATLEEEWSRITARGYPWGLIIATLFWQFTLTYALALWMGWTAVAVGVSALGLVVCGSETARRLK